VKLKIGEISKRSGLPASTIRYYVAEGLLPRPEKTNEKMAYYDESCIDRLRIIQNLQEKRYYPLFLIKNILRRLDQGLSLTEAETVERAVFGSSDGIRGNLMDRQAFLAATGLTEKELKQAEKLGILIPHTRSADKPLYNEDDMRVGRDGLKKLIGFGMKLTDLSFWSEFGQQIVEKELDLRRKLVAGKSTRENVQMTAEMTSIGDLYRAYILHRLFRRQVERNIRKSLEKKRKNPA